MDTMDTIINETPADCTHHIGRMVDRYLASNMNARQESADAELLRKLAETTDLMQKAGMV